jgi:hypothetical protein
VCVGIAIGVLMIIFNQPLSYFIIPGYIIALVLTLFGSDDLVCVSWDSAGVATGPVVVPLVLAIGVALGNALHVVGFGIVALASVCPIGMCDGNVRDVAVLQWFGSSIQQY